MKRTLTTLTMLALAVAGCSQEPQTAEDLGKGSVDLVEEAASGDVTADEFAARMDALAEEAKKEIGSPPQATPAADRSIAIAEEEGIKEEAVHQLEKSALGFYAKWFEMLNEGLTAVYERAKAATRSPEFNAGSNAKRTLSPPNARAGNATVIASDPPERNEPSPRPGSNVTDSAFFTPGSQEDDEPARETTPTLLTQLLPVYTEEARKAERQGTVILETIVQPDGTVEIARVARGLGFGLDEAAIAAVQQWRFRPGTRNGEPVPVSLKIEVNFSLR